MTWAILIYPSIDEWRLHPTLFPTRDAARFAAIHWPELLKYNVKRVVSVNVDVHDHQHQHQHQHQWRTE